MREIHGCWDRHMIVSHLLILFCCRYDNILGIAHQSFYLVLTFMTLLLTCGVLGELFGMLFRLTFTDAYLVNSSQENQSSQERLKLTN